MNQYTLIAGINGVGKSSLRGVLEGQGLVLGHIIDADYIAKENNFDVIKAGREAILEIDDCLKRNISFTQETTLAGKRIERTLIQARKQGYYVLMYYIGIDSVEESLKRIKNRVQKGGHDIPKIDVERRYAKRYDSLKKVLPYCDEVVFYDNENGFIKVAGIKNNRFYFTNGYRPKWLMDVMKECEF